MGPRTGSRSAGGASEKGGALGRGSWEECRWAGIVGGLEGRRRRVRMMEGRRGRVRMMEGRRRRVGRMEERRGRFDRTG